MSDSKVIPIGKGKRKEKSEGESFDDIIKKNKEKKERLRKERIEHNKKVRDDYDL